MRNTTPCPVTPRNLFRPPGRREDLRGRSVRRGKTSLLRRVFLERLLDHRVELALHLDGIAFVLARDGAPDQRALGRVTQVDDQRAFGVRTADDRGTPS